MEVVILSHKTASRNLTGAVGVTLLVFFFCCFFRFWSLQVGPPFIITVTWRKMTGCTRSAHHVTLSQVGNVQTVVPSRPFAHAQQGRHEQSAKPWGAFTILASLLCAGCAGKESNPGRQINIPALRVVRTAAEKPLWLSSLPKKTQQHDAVSHMQEEDRVVRCGF